MADDHSRRKRKWDVPEDSRDRRRGDKRDYKDDRRDRDREYRDYRGREDSGNDHREREHHRKDKDRGDMRSRQGYRDTRDSERSPPGRSQQSDRRKSKSPEKQQGATGGSDAPTPMNPKIVHHQNETMGAVPNPTTGDDMFGNKTSLPEKHYDQDGDFIIDLEINDLKNRYVLTRGAAQAQIQQETGADVTSRGKYYPDKSMASERDPPLYLHITAKSRENLMKAREKIQELINQGLPQLIDERPSRRRQQEEEQQHRPPQREKRKWAELRVPVGMEPTRNFNIRAKIVGPAGANVKHIHNSTGVRVQLKGQGSGYYEQETGQEAEGPMFIMLTGPDESQLEKAKQLTVDLIGTVKQEYEQAQAHAKQMMDTASKGANYGNAYAGYDASGADQKGDYSAAWAQYYAQYGGASADPYAQYYQGYDYSQYYQQAPYTTSDGSQQLPPTAQVPPPPPPPQEPPPPPPPDTHNMPPPPSL